MLKLEKDGKGQYKVYWENGVHIGEFTMLEDGYYVFFPIDGHYGFWNEHSLQVLADSLKDLNKDWDEQVRSDPLINDKGDLS